MNAPMLPRKSHHSEKDRARRTSATVRLSASADAYRDGDITREQLRSSARVCILAGVRESTISEVSGLTVTEVKSLR